jgi:hypothetical protein
MNVANSLHVSAFHAADYSVWLTPGRIVRSVFRRCRR